MLKLQRREMSLFAAPVLVLVLASGSNAWSRWSSRCTDSCTTSVGDYDEKLHLRAHQAALQEMLQQVKKCPRASLYKVHYTLSRRGKNSDNVDIMFTPQTGELGFVPGYSAEIELYRKVDVAAILSVAFGTGKLTDLTKVGCDKIR